MDKCNQTGPNDPFCDPISFQEVSGGETYYQFTQPLPNPPPSPSTKYNPQMGPQYSLYRLFDIRINELVDVPKVELLI